MTGASAAASAASSAARRVAALQARARSAALRDALAQTGELPELRATSAPAESASSRAEPLSLLFERAEQVAGSMPPGTLFGAAIRLHCAERRSWLGDDLAAARRDYDAAADALRASIVVDGDSEERREDFWACRNARQAYCDTLRAEDEADRVGGGGGDGGGDAPMSSERAAALSLTRELHALLLSPRAPASPSSSPELAARAQSLLDRAREQAPALVGRALLTLGPALQSDDYLQAALAHYDRGSDDDDDDDDAGEAADRDDFALVTALCENAAPLLRRDDTKGAEELLSRALQIARDGQDEALALVPLHRLAACYTARGDAITAEGLYRACEERDIFPAATAEDGATALSPAARQHVRGAVLIDFAALLRRLEWNGQPRTAEAQAAERKLRDMAVFGGGGRSDASSAAAPLHRLWYAHAARATRDTTL